jgi:hypothetical protein
MGDASGALPKHPEWECGCPSRADAIALYSSELLVIPIDPADWPSWSAPTEP